MNVIKTVLASLCFGFTMTCLSNILGSVFVIQFLDENLIMLLVALFALNSTTTSVILSKMIDVREKQQKLNLIFENARREIVISIYEQVALIFLAVIFQMLRSSNYLNANESGLLVIIDSLIVAVFAYSIGVTFDTAKAAHVLYDFSIKNRV